MAHKAQRDFTTVPDSPLALQLESRRQLPPPRVRHVRFSTGSQGLRADHRCRFIMKYERRRRRGGLETV
jgi:hypothetical protein